MKTTRGILIAALMSGTVLASGIARADYFVLGASSNGTPRVYKRTNDGVCSEFTPLLVEPTYYFEGTNSADVMFVYDRGPNLSWCNRTIRALTELPPGKLLSVYGRLGRDTIWAGWELPTHIVAGGINADDNSDNTIYGGAALQIWGGSLANTIFAPSARNGEVRGGAAGDNFCTHVSGQFFNVNVGFIHGGRITGDPFDVRIGPAARSETSIEFFGTQSDACDWTYAAMTLQIQQMLSL
jgi:hypothetical protein